MATINDLPEPRLPFSGDGIEVSASAPFISKELHLQINERVRRSLRKRLRWLTRRILEKAVAGGAVRITGDEQVKVDLMVTGIKGDLVTVKIFLPLTGEAAEVQSVILKLLRRRNQFYGFGVQDNALIASVRLFWTPVETKCSLSGSTMTRTVLVSPKWVRDSAVA